MRLVCPNCEAKYEVPEDAIPETGRDVQCANCGHAWYQMRARTAASDVAPAVASPVAAVPSAPSAPEPEPMPEPAPEVAEALPPADPPQMAEVEADLAGHGAGASVAADPGEADPGVTEALAGDMPEASGEAAVDAEDASPGDAAAGVQVETAVETLVGDPADAPVEPELIADAADVEPVAEPLPTAAETLEATVTAAAETPEAVVAVGSEALPPVQDDPAAPPERTDEDDDGESANGDAPADSPAQAAPAAYAVDDSVLAILREEAEREARARKAEASGLETQPDLGVDSIVPPLAPVAVVAAAATASAASDDMGDAALRPSARRDLLPDVEEINSTLRPSETKAAATATAPEAEAAPVEERSSFRTGFLLVMTLAILAAALYIAAPLLRDLIPSLAGFLDGYVGFIDALRLRLDGMMQTATAAIGG